MLKEDKDKLLEIFKTYPAKHILANLVEIAAQAVDELSDEGRENNHVKPMSVLAQSLEDIASGRPFLV